MKEKTETLQLRISQELKSKLKKVSQETGVSMSKMIKKAIEDYLHNTHTETLQDDINYLKSKIDSIAKAVTS